MESQSSPSTTSALAKIVMNEVMAIKTASEQSLNVGVQGMYTGWEANRLAKESFTLELLKNPRYKDPRHLVHAEFMAFSQSGEDGVIKEILQRIGVVSRWFVEIGVGPDLENNTTFLLSQGWKGMWVDCLPEEQIRKAPGLLPFLERGDLKYLPNFVTSSNVRALVEPHLPQEEIDVFSLDLDRNTYHIYRAMEFLRPRVLVVEYNSFYPPPIRWIVQEDPASSDWTTMNFGASLASFTDLAKERGYELVHCGLTGVNAFFVRKDLLNPSFYLPSDVLSFFEPYRSFLTYKHTLNRSL